MSPVPLLSFEELRELGVTTVGEQFALKESCTQGSRTYVANVLLLKQNCFFYFGIACIRPIYTHSLVCLFCTSKVFC